MKKSSQILSEVLKVLAPGQENLPSQSLLEKRNSDPNTLEVISSAYQQVTGWGIQRQILSLQMNILWQSYSNNFQN